MVYYSRADLIWPDGLFKNPSETAQAVFRCMILTYRCKV